MFWLKIKCRIKIDDKWERQEIVEEAPLLFDEAIEIIELLRKNSYCEIIKVELKAI